MGAGLSNLDRIFSKVQKLAGVVQEISNIFVIDLREHKAACAESERRRISMGKESREGQGGGQGQHLSECLYVAIR